MPDLDLFDQLRSYGEGLEGCVATVSADEVTAAAASRDGSASRSRRMWLVTAAAAVLVAVVVAGQFVAGGPIPFGASADDVALRDALVGRRFVVSSITENGQPKVLVGPSLSGEPAIGVITFGRSGNPETWSAAPGDDVYVSSSGGCNSTSGGFEVVDGRLILSGDQAVTQAGCAPDINDQDQWLSSFLAAGPTIALDGERLTLATATTTIELVERAEPPSPPPPTTPAPLDPSDLTGRTFVATSGLVNGVERRIVGTADEPDPDRLRMTFGDGTVSVRAGCSSASGPYTIEMGRIEGVTTTADAGCPAALMDQDAWLHAFFATPPSLGLDGDYLTLGNQIDTIIVFVDEAASTPVVTPSPLAGVRWTLDAMASVPDLPSSATGTFDADLVVTEGEPQTVYLRDGCNVVTGAVRFVAATATSGTITMSELDRTDATCAATIDPVVDAMTAIQSGTWSYVIDTDRLELTDGTRTLVFTTT